MAWKFFYDRGLVANSLLQATDRLQYLLGGFRIDSAGTIASGEQSERIKDVLYTEPEFDDAEIFSLSKQTILLVGDSNVFRTQAGWQAFLRAALTMDTQISNHWNFLSIPEVDTNPTEYDVERYDSQLIYNYGFYDYEILTSNITTNALPNYMISDFHSNFPTNYTTDFLSVGGMPELANMNPVHTFGDVHHQWYFNPNSQYNAFDEGEEIKYLDYNYHKVYTEIFNSNNIPSSLLAFAEKNSNIFVLYNTDTAKTDLLPHFLKLNIPQASLPWWGFEFNDLLDTVKFNRFVLAYMKRLSAPGLTEIGAGPTLTDFYSTSWPSSGYDIESIKMYDVSNWLFDTAIFDTPELNNELYLIDPADDFINSNNATFERAIRKIIFAGQLKQKIKQHLRTFESLIVTPEIARSEIFAFKVEKFLNDITGSPMQTYYIPINREEDFTFIDSQFEYDTRYAYKVSVFAVVLGSKYMYQNLFWSVDDDKYWLLQDTTGQSKFTLAFPENYETYKAEVELTVRPSIKILEVPIFNFTERLLEPPVLAPNIHFFNDSGNNKNIKVFLNDNFSTILNEDELQPYQILTSEDIIYRDKLKEAQHLEDKFRYSSKSNTGIFEVYRTDVRPKSYLDFDGQIIGIIQNNYSQLNMGNGSSAEFIDTITSHKKYYYLFRAVSNHGHKSNPTAIYEIELVEDSDETYLLVDAFELREEEIYSVSKDMRVFMKIVPSLEQVMIDNSAFSDNTSAYNHEQSFVANNIGSGLEESVWDFDDLTSYGKRFKIRLTSKHTGKKLDLNIAFKLKQKGT